MMIAYMLAGLNVDYIADFAFRNSLLDWKIERGVAKHVANHNLVAVFLNAVNKRSHLFFICRKRLFKEHIIALFKKRNWRFDVLLVHCSVNYCVGQLRCFCKLWSRVKAVFFGKAEHFHCFFLPYFIGVGNAYDFKLVGVCERKLRIDKGSVSCADDYRCNRFVFHYFIISKKIIKAIIVHVFQKIKSKIKKIRHLYFQMP